MSPIGRIFIVLNLVLAVAFLGWASSALGSSHEWKTKFLEEEQAHNEDVARLQTEVDAERTEKQRAQSSRDQLQLQYNNLDATKTQVEVDLADSRERHNTMQGLYDKMSQDLENYDDRNADLTQLVADKATEISNLTNQANDFRSERDALENEKGDLERLRDTQNDAIAQLERENTARQAKIDELETLIATAQEVFQSDFSQLLAMPHISGAVLMVSSEVQPGLISINRGAADDVKRGFTFEIYSGGQFKGRVRVVDVQANMCTAIIEKTFAGRTIEQGDSAATHI